MWIYMLRAKGEGANSYFYDALVNLEHSDILSQTLGASVSEHEHMPCHEPVPLSSDRQPPLRDKLFRVVSKHCPISVGDVGVIGDRYSRRDADPRENFQPVWGGGNALYGSLKGRAKAHSLLDDGVEVLEPRRLRVGDYAGGGALECPGFLELHQELNPHRFVAQDII